MLCLLLRLLTGKRVRAVLKLLLLNFGRLWSFLGYLGNPLTLSVVLSMIQVGSSFTPSRKGDGVMFMVKVWLLGGQFVRFSTNTLAEARQLAEALVNSPDVSGVQVVDSCNSPVSTRS